MKTLYIKPAEFSPKVILSTESNLYLIRGTAILTHPEIFFQPVFRWIYDFEEYALTLPEDKKTLELHLYLDFLNSKTAVYLVHLLGRLERLREKTGVDVSVCWEYSLNYAEMLETGKILKSLTHLPFTFKEQYYNYNDLLDNVEISKQIQLPQPSAFLFT